MILIALLGLVAFLGSSASAASADECPNEAFRVGFSAQLPECRAYERVSPADKGGTDLTTNSYLGIGTDVIMGADAPGAVTFPGWNAFGDAVSSSLINTYLSRRTASGWQTHAINPPVKAGLFSGAVLRYGLTADLSKGLFAGPTKSRLAPIPLTLVDSASRQMTTVVAPPEPSEPQAVGYSNDMSHVVVRSFSVPLTADSPAGNSSYLYDWTQSGGLVNVGRLPDNSFATGDVEPAIRGVRYHPVSDDGSRIFFQTGGQLYLRENATTTTQVSAPAPGAPAEPAQPAKFLFASTDSSNVFFCSAQRLTADSTATSEGGFGSGDIYRYDVTTGELTDLTVTDDPKGAAACAGEVLGGADDASRIYFQAEGKLTDDAPPNEEEENDGKIYVWHDDGTAKGELTYVTSVPSTTLGSNQSLGDASGTRVSPNGRWMVFAWGPEEPFYYQIRRYDATTKELVCVSCNPNGVTNSRLHRGAFEGENNTQMLERLPRNLLDDGRVFFESHDALVPQDINEDWDVYEYADGQRHLISSGTDGSGEPYDRNHPSQRVYFGDASADGTDVYFETRSQLVPGDNDELIDLYDARVDGGFKSELAPPSPNCDGEACKPPPASGAEIPGAGSAAFAGAGNQGRNSSPRTRKKCGKGHKKCHKHHRSHRHANANRGGSK
jgi:hypothetical protein